jgi:hypothetical protein
VSINTNVLDTSLCDKVCEWLPSDLWFSPGNICFTTVPLVEQELSHLSETTGFTSIFHRACAGRYLASCVMLCWPLVYFCPFSFGNFIVFALRRITSSDSSFGNFKLFFSTVFLIATIYKTLHRKLRSSNTNPAKTPGWMQVLWNGKQYLFH